MFSYSEYPLKSSSKVNDTIDFTKLVKIIKNHPKSDLIEKVRKLRSEGEDEECRRIKQSLLPWITPNCVVNKRLLKDKFEENFIHSSGYIYFDIDEKIKETFILEYGQFVSLITTSATGRGISILVRINRSIKSDEEFVLIYDYIKSTMFKGVNFDDNVRHIGSSWIIPWDEDPFINYEYELIIPDSLQITKVSNDVLYTHPQHIHRMNPIEIPIVTNEISDSGILFETKVEIDELFEIIPIPIHSIRFPKFINDGSKHKVFRKITHDFLNLNPNADIETTLNYISHINRSFAKPPMDYHHLRDIIISQFQHIKNNPDYLYSSKSQIRLLHYKERKKINSKERRIYANKIRGVLDKTLTWKRIQEVVNFLLDEYGEYTYKDISKNTGYSISTIKRHHSRNKIEYEMEFESILKEINDTVQKSYEK